MARGVESPKIYLDLQDRVIFRLVRVCDTFYKQDETYDVQILVNALVDFPSFKMILHCLGALSKSHGVYFHLVLAVLLSALDVSVNLFSKQKLGHVLVNVPYHGWYWDDHILLLLDGYPDILRIVALSPIITRQGLGGSGELVGFGSCPQIVYVTFQILSNLAQSYFPRNFCDWILVLSYCVMVHFLVSLNIRLCRG